MPRERAQARRHRDPSLDQILDKIASLIPGERGVLIGMVNIHTHQAEMLLEHFEHEAGEEHVDELAASLDPARQPAVPPPAARGRPPGRRDGARGAGVNEYLYSPDVVRVTLVMGVITSMLFYERLHLTTGGAIVPAYLALGLQAPDHRAMTVFPGSSPT